MSFGAFPQCRGVAVSRLFALPDLPRLTLYAGGGAVTIFLADRYYLV